MDGPGRMLVTGGSGFLGAHVVEAAARRGWIVAAHGHRGAFPAELPRGAALLRADLSSEAGILAALESCSPRAVVHTAALSRHADCERDPALARALNVDGPRAIADWCARRGARLVHVSTDLAFGALPAPPGGFTELDAPGPISDYARSKVAGELEVARAHPAALIARLPLLVGPSHGRRRGASDSVLAAIDRGERPELFEDEWRTPLDVRSAAEALVELAALEPGGILHVAGPERLSRYEIGLRTLRRRGLRSDEALARLARATRAAAGAAAERPADVSLDSTRARGLLKTLLVGLESGST